METGHDPSLWVTPSRIEEEGIAAGYADVGVVASDEWGLRIHRYDGDVEIDSVSSNWKQETEYTVSKALVEGTMKC